MSVSRLCMQRLQRTLLSAKVMRPRLTVSRGVSVAALAFGVGSAASLLHLQSTEQPFKCEHFDVGSESDHFHLLSTVAKLSTVVDSKKLLKLLHKRVKEQGEDPLLQEEVVGLFSQSGIEDKEISANIFAVMDFNKSGSMEAHEVAACFTLFQKGNELDRFKYLFRCLDLDGSGKVDRDEFRRMLTALLEARYHLCGLSDPKDPDEWYYWMVPDDFHTLAKLKSNMLVRDIFLFADQNRDGELSVKEFLHWCKRGGHAVKLIKDLLSQTLSHTDGGW